ncbi:MAG: transporter ATP-binding protein [Microbacteriaceae bacterium]|nr:transporter ATP-binding protein [Microbacteriaceae bacterium]
MSAGPLDPRLLRYASASRWFLVGGAVVGFLQTLSIVGAAWFATAVIVGVIDGRTTGDLRAEIAAFAASIVARSVFAWLLDVLAARGAARVKSQLRTRVVVAIGRLGPAWMSSRNSARVTTVVAQGLDALDGYFAKYLPQLILTAVATPTILIVLLLQDVTTGIIIVATLPLIPLFMVLIGWATQAVQRKQWAALATLSTGFLDVVDGLSTLTIYGRQHRQVDRIDRVTEDYRARTMSVLRISFVSGFVLELAGSLSVAIVAVAIGLRLVNGDLALTVGLFVLLLTPEAYTPLRQVGAQFHAAADGVAAADEVFEILDATPAVDPVASVTAVPGGATLAVRALTVRYADRVVVDRVSHEFARGRITAIAGRSGAGKSSLVAAILGFVPAEGELTIDGAPLEPAAARKLVAWAPQRAALMAGTVAENVALGAETVDDELVGAAMRLAAAATIDPRLALGVNGSGLSGGQAQRVSLARAFYRVLDRSCPVMILDEPSSALDAATERELVAGLRRLADSGVAVVVVSHRAALLDAADATLDLGAPVGVAS